MIPQPVQRPTTFREALTPKRADCPLHSINVCRTSLTHDDEEATTGRLALHTASLTATNRSTSNIF
ncbi:hypothetical protein BD414DRAFT_496967 [Trametes punicea]|nr:hypothetical protein BD414DRAFT_496967 [Trametes punicea]